MGVIFYFCSAPTTERQWKRFLSWTLGVAGPKIPVNSDATRLLSGARFAADQPRYSRKQ